MGNKRIELLKDASRHGCNILVRCRCGHRRVLSTAMLLALFPSNKAIGAIRFRCLVCDELAREWAGIQERPCPLIRNEADLKRLRAQYRG